MKNVLFIMLPYASHYTACFPLARKLKTEGYEIVFAGQFQNRGLVEAEGFTFVVINYTYKIYVKDIKTSIGYFIKTLLDKNSIIQKYKQWYRCLIDLEKVIINIKPEVVFIDEHLNYWGLNIKKIISQTYLLNTKLSSKRIKGTPPLNSDFIPDGSFKSMIICELLWMKYILFKLKMKTFENLAFLGKNEDSFEKRLLSKSSFKNQYRFRIDNSFYDGIENFKTYIVAPKELEFFKSKNQEEYLNFKIERNEESLITEEYKVVKNQLLELKKQNVKIVYFSMGTIPEGDHDIVRSYILKIFEALKNRNDLHVIASTSRINIDNFEAKNISYYYFLPQLDVLSFVDLMITHGGLGSVKECIQKQVPMLVYPLNYQIDQPGNGARVSLKKWGIMGNIAKDDSKSIIDKIHYAISLKPNLLHVSNVYEVEQSNNFKKNLAKL